VGEKADNSHMAKTAAAPRVDAFSNGAWRGGGAAGSVAGSVAASGYQRVNAGGGM
jgi:hypothetical protein